MAALFHYRAFDLVIASELECPQLLVCDAQNHDIRIYLGEVPRGADFEEGAERQLILRIRDLASFWIRGGAEIIVQPHQGCELQDLQLILLGSVMTAMLWQRGYFVLHANAVASAEGAILCAGPSGIGKSTVAASCYSHGYRMLSDDICAIRLNSPGLPDVLSSYPYLKLWDDMVAALDLTQKISSVVRRNQEKYYISCIDNFEPKSQPLKAIFMIDPHAPVGEARLLKGTEAFRQLLHNAHRPQYLALMGLLEKSFQQAAELASKLPIYSVSRLFLSDPQANLFCQLP